MTGAVNTFEHNQTCLLMEAVLLQEIMAVSHRPPTNNCGKKRNAIKRWATNMRDKD